jgi:hypothetical protein
MNAEALKRFILAPKPDWCMGMDVAVVCYLITVADKAGRCSPMQVDLANASGASINNLRGLRSCLTRLDEHRWITWRKGVPGERHRYQVHFKNLPGKEEHETP